MAAPSTRRRKPGAAPRKPRRSWTRYSDAHLLELRLRDLDLKVEGTWLEACVSRLYDELERRGIRFQPHVWLSNEWFAPDGVPGIAIPFYLAHERLMKLERRQLFAVEGGSLASCMKILRHEAGHVLDTAYRLHFKPGWRANFGRYTVRYPDTYRPRPNSRRHVLHLDAWYAQAHPAEDFAETFAVWLTPRSGWRQRYAHWPRALAKLQYVDALMHDWVIGQPPRVRSSERVDPASRSSMTLREYYVKKRLRLRARRWPSFNQDLARLFSAHKSFHDAPTAASFLRKHRAELRSTVIEWTGTHAYTIEQILQDLMDRCRERKLRLAIPEEKAKMQATLLLIVHTIDSLKAGRYEVAL